MNQSFLPDGPTEQSAFEGYMLQVFPEDQVSNGDLCSPHQESSHLCLASNSDLFVFGSSPSDLIAAQKLLYMFEKLKENFVKDRKFNGTGLKEFPEELNSYYSSQGNGPFADYTESDGTFMAIVGFATYDSQKASEGNEDCFRVDSILFVWADASNYGRDLDKFCDSVETFAIENGAADPKFYRNLNGMIDHDGYSVAVGKNSCGGAQQFPPFYNHKQHDDNPQHRINREGFGGSWSVAFLESCLTK
jgi:hypothetical protein